MPCPLCSNSNTPLFSRDKKRDYYQCSHCELVFVPSEFHLGPDDEKARYDLHQNDPENSGYRNFLGKLLTPVIQRIKKDAKGLDFGSGPEPVLAEMFKEEGYAVNMYDIFYAPTPENLDTSYDFITLSEVAEHLAEPGKVIGELISILNPGGILAIMTQPAEDKSLFDRWHYKNDLTHICFFSEKSLSVAAKTHGCSLEKCGKDIFIMKRSGFTQDVSFISNGFELKGVLHYGLKKNAPVIIGSHGLLSTKQSQKQIVLAEKCCEYGIAYLRIDHTGCGDSQGELVKTTIDTRVGDILASAEFLADSGFRNSPMALFGSSMGGATCIKSWNALMEAGHDMKCLVTLAAPVQGKTITETNLADEEELNGIPLSFYTENMGFDLTENIEGLNNILIFHGDEDEIVPFSNAGTILEHAGTEKKLIINKGGDHRMTDPEHQERFYAQASQWFNTYMSE